MLSIKFSVCGNTKIDLLLQSKGLIIEMEIKYFKLKNDYIALLPCNVQFTLKKNSIFHIQNKYRSPITGDDMVVVAIDKCTPIAVPVHIGTILD
ncbi:MAG TPA: hypothetical protein DD429_00025 [Clostridiaceae bacterium]|nr:hypothetical protein [Clostridiaceae bacterium]